MGYFAGLIIAALGTTTVVNAQSNLLESVKRNPDEAQTLCSKFRSLNSRGISASSKESIMAISTQKNLSFVDAEILSTYVRGLHCPDVV